MIAQAPLQGGACAAAERELAASLEDHFAQLPPAEAARLAALALLASACWQRAQAQAGGGESGAVRQQPTAADVLRALCQVSAGMHCPLRSTPFLLAPWLAQLYQPHCENPGSSQLELPAGFYTTSSPVPSSSCVVWAAQHAPARQRQAADCAGFFACPCLQPWALVTPCGTPSHIRDRAYSWGQSASTQALVNYNCTLHRTSPAWTMGSRLAGAASLLLPPAEVPLSPPAPCRCVSMAWRWSHPPAPLRPTAWAWRSTPASA